MLDPALMAKLLIIMDTLDVNTIFINLQERRRMIQQTRLGFL